MTHSRSPSSSLSLSTTLSKSCCCSPFAFFYHYYSALESPKSEQSERKEALFELSVPADKRFRKFFQAQNVAYSYLVTGESESDKSVPGRKPCFG